VQLSSFRPAAWRNFALSAFGTAAVLPLVAAAAALETLLDSVFAACQMTSPDRCF
jgi:hypothetical protein